MSEENKPAAPPKRKRRTRSLVSSRFGVQLPILLLFIAFAIAAGLFLYREISADRFRVMRGADPIYFTSDKVDGLGFGSDLRCQGLTVGRVRVVKVLEKEQGTIEEITVDDHTVKRVRFAVEATLEKPYANWIFKDNATVAKGVGPAYLGLASVELEIDQIMPVDAPKTPQHLTLRYIEGTKLGDLQDDLGLVLQALVRRSDDLAIRIKNGEASSLERILWNMDQATRRMDAAIAKLTEDQAGQESALSRLITTIDRLAQLVEKLEIQVESLTSQTLVTMKKSQEAIATLVAKVDEVEKGVLQMIGETPAQRRGFQRDLQDTVDNLKTASATLKDILPRVGDTALGKMLIRKKKGEADEEEAEEVPTPRRKSGPRN